MGAGGGEPIGVHQQYRTGRGSAMLRMVVPRYRISASIGNASRTRTAASYGPSRCAMLWA